MNPDRIPIANLAVRLHGQPTYQPLSLTPFALHGQSTASAPSGDAFGNDFQVQIPWVRGDDYAVTLEYIAVARP
jgi:hypothetical protein